jgi:hypothetical protein
MTPPAAQISHPAASRRISTTAWWVALLGIGLGYFISQVSPGVNGPAIAILGFAPLMVSLERWAFPGLAFGPIGFAYLYHALGYAIGPLWQKHIMGYLFAIEEGFVPAQWGGVLGLLTFSVVFPITFRWASRWFAPRAVEANATEANLAQWPGYTIALLLAVGFSILFGFVTGAANRLGGLQSSLSASTVHSALTPLHYPLFFFLGYMAAKRGTAWRNLWLATFLGYSMFYLLDGGRGATAFAAIFSAMGLIWGGASPRKVLLICLVIAIPFVPLSGVVLQYRDSIVYAGLDVGTGFEERVEFFARATDDFSRVGGQSLASSTSAFARAITATFVDMVFILTPDVIPFSGWDGIEDAVYIFTPLILNPNRPSLDEGNQLAIKYGSSSLRGNYMTTVGAGYARFGWPGIVLLYAITTVVYSMALAIGWMRRDRPEWMGFVVFLTFQASSIWSTTLITIILTAIWTLPRAFALFWAIAWLQRKLKREKNRYV